MFEIFLWFFVLAAYELIVSFLFAVNGNWGPWGSWASCSVTCGGGIKTRTRVCDSPVPSNGGDTCPGLSVESGSCNTDSCSSSPGMYFEAHDWSTKAKRDHIWSCNISTVFGYYETFKIVLLVILWNRTCLNSIFLAILIPHYVSLLFTYFHKCSSFPRQKCFINLIAAWSVEKTVSAFLSL